MITRLKGSFLNTHSLTDCDRSTGGAIPADINLPKRNNRNTRIRCKLFSKLTIKTPDPEHISHILRFF